MSDDSSFVSCKLSRDAKNHTHSSSAPPRDCGRGSSVDDKHVPDCFRTQHGTAMGPEHGPDASLTVHASPEHALSLQGSRTVNRCHTCDSGTRHTCTITVALNGDKLKPFCVFKGRSNGRIAQREFPNNPCRDQVELVCQEAAWQDGKNMLLRIDHVLVPHLQEKAQGAPALLLLDQFSGHWTEEVATKPEETEIASHKIPAGCTCLVQPIDVGIGKPFKDRVGSKWWDWMLDQGADAANLTHATMQQATQWAPESWADTSEEIAKASWRKSERSHFENEDGE